MVTTAFPLPWEHVRWQTRRLAVSDFRIVALARRPAWPPSGAGRTVSAEIALHDVGAVRVEPSRAERLTGIGTLVIASSREGDPPIRVPRVVRARRTALAISLLVADIRGVPPDESIAALPMPSIWQVEPAMPLKAALISPALLLVALTVVVAGLSCHQSHVVYSANDPIRPNGIMRSHAEIVAFMEAEVMPFARVALEPIVGRGKVRCETCHGADAEARHWKMPAIVALPEPSVRAMAPSAGSDSQVRNALHGYLADEVNQRKAGHMRGVVLPGMAALLGRPAYDFGKSYEFNQERNAFGCYHCHQVTS